MKKKKLLPLLILPILVLSSCSLSSLFKKGFPNVSEEPSQEQFTEPVTCFFYYDAIHYEYFNFEKNSYIDLSQIQPKEVPEDMEFYTWCTDKTLTYTVSTEEYTNLKVSNQMTFYAKYLNYYTVEYKDYDGSILSSKKVLYGKTTYYDGSNPQRTDKGGYKFSDWVAEGNYEYHSPVKENRTFTASYDRTFEIHYLDDRGVSFATIKNVNPEKENLETLDYNKKYYENYDTIPVKKIDDEYTYGFDSFYLSDINYDTAVVTVRMNYNKYYTKNVNAVVDDTYLKEDKKFVIASIPCVETYDGKIYYCYDGLDESLKRKYFLAYDTISLNCNELVKNALENEQLKEDFSCYTLSSNYGEEEVVDVNQDDLSINLTATAIRESFINENLNTYKYTNEDFRSINGTQYFALEASACTTDNGSSQNPSFDNQEKLQLTFNKSRKITNDTLKINQNNTVSKVIDNFEYSYSINKAVIDANWKMEFLGNEYGYIFPYFNIKISASSEVPVSLNLKYQNFYSKESNEKKYETNAIFTINIFQPQYYAGGEWQVTYDIVYLYTLSFTVEDENMSFDVNEILSYEYCCLNDKYLTLDENYSHLYVENYADGLDGRTMIKNPSDYDRDEAQHCGPSSTSGVTWTIETKNEKICLKDGKIRSCNSTNKTSYMLPKSVFSNYSSAFYVFFEFTRNYENVESEIEYIVENL